MNRLPPQSIEAEMSALSMCLTGGSEYFCCELSPNDFYKTAHQKIFKAIKDLHGCNTPIDLSSVVVSLRDSGSLEDVGGASYISKIINDVPAPDSASYYCSTIKDKAIKRLLIVQHSEILNQCYEDEPAEKIAIGQRSIHQIDLPTEKETMTKQVEDWLKCSPGDFSVVDIDRDLKITEPWQKRLRTIACEQLVKDGLLDRTGNRRGNYRPCDSQLLPQDFMHCQDTPVELWMPFELTSMVDVFERNIITIGGEKNAGKTTLMLNIAWCNRDRYHVHYFNSEMGDQELKRRIMKSEYPDLMEWSKVSFYERARNFSDVIKSGPNDLNIIDFLELQDEFWKIGQFVRDIHDKLGRGIAIIAVQKKTGADNPRGGEFVKEKSRLHLDLSNDPNSEYRHKLKINPGKNWHTDTNPNGKYVKFKIVNGNILIPFRGVDGAIKWSDDFSRPSASKTV